MQIISIVNKKGGVAKTTTALALASGLSKRNFHVLAIDCDAQANFSKASGGEDDVVGSFDILTGKENINEAIQELPLYHLIGADNDSALLMLLSTSRDVSLCSRKLSVKFTLLTTSALSTILLLSTLPLLILLSPATKSSSVRPLRLSLLTASWSFPLLSMMFSSS